MDLAVPFSPRMSTPPILGLIALRSNAFFMCSWPTMALNGKASLILWRIDYYFLSGLEGIAVKSLNIILYRLGQYTGGICSNSYMTKVVNYSSHNAMNLDPTDDNK
jgi:hypothetical protein